MSSDLATYHKSITDVIPGASHTSLQLELDIKYETWESLGVALAGYHEQMNAETSRIQFLLGDWWRHGERVFGEQAAQAIDPHNRALQTVRNYAWVCDAIEPDRRRDDVDFSHHVVVAKLPPTEQSAWLEKCAEHGYSVAQLKRELKTIDGDVPDEKPAALASQEQAEAPQTHPDDIEIIKNGNAVAEINSPSRDFHMTRPSAKAAVVTIGKKQIQFYSNSDVIVTVKEAQA